MGFTRAPGPPPATAESLSPLALGAPCAAGTEGRRTAGRGELDEDAVAAQGDDEGLLAHTAALRLPGHRALEHTDVFICERREAGVSRQVLGPPSPPSRHPRFFQGATTPAPQALPCALPAQPTLRTRRWLVSIPSGDTGCRLSSRRGQVSTGQPGLR